VKKGQLGKPNKGENLRTSEPRDAIDNSCEKKSLKLERKRVSRRKGLFLEELHREAHNAESMATNICRLEREK